MAMSTRPQLLQAIRLLQYSSVELAAFLQEELERNPLLESESPDSSPLDAGSGEAPLAVDGDPQASDRAMDGLPVVDALADDLGVDIGNAFGPDAPAVGPEAPSQNLDGSGLSATSWTGAGAGGGDGVAPDLDAFVASKPSLYDHLAEQLALACPDARSRIIGHAIIDSIDETGYVREPVGEIAARLSVQPAEVEKTLATIQTFEPSGIGARDLAECLAIQLREKDRFDPAMQIFVANLPLLARRDFGQLARLCGVDAEDVADMAAEIRRLDPRPGRAFSDAPVRSVIADVIVRAASDGSWIVELNPDALPRVLVNQTYAARIGAGARGADRTFISNCLQNANWTTKSLEQRSRTILKVASEIVRLQDGFLTRGVEYLRPLNLRNIADAIGMHESTVSREIFLLDLDPHRRRRRRGAFCGGGALPHQADDRS